MELIYLPAEIISVHIFLIPEHLFRLQVFTLRAFDVDKTNSNRGKVVIRNLSRLAEGMLRCEISEEAPSFHTAARTSSLEVVGEFKTPKREFCFILTM